MTTLVFVSGFCIVAVLVYMARYSGRVRVEQSRLIDAPLDAVYAKVVDFGQWRQWNPWLDPTAATTLRVSERGDQEGSCGEWDSENMGTGFVQHVRLHAGQRIEQRLRLRHPFTVSGRSCWTFKDSAGKTEVSWSLRGRVGFSMRAFAPTVKSSLALDCRYGLDQLASVLEPETAQRYSIEHLGLRHVAPRHYVYKTYQGTISGLPQAMRTALTELRQQLASKGLEATGLPMAIYFKTNIKLRTTVCHIGVPIAANVDAGPMPTRDVAAHHAYVVRLHGSPKTLEIAWYHAMQRMVASKIRPDQRIPPFESYLVQGVGDKDCVTELHLPVLDAGSSPLPVSLDLSKAPT